MPKQILLILLLMGGLLSPAFTQTLQGTVTDSTGKPLAFATIKLGETKQGMVADLKGRFQLKPDNHFTYITIGYLGYKAKRIELSQLNRNEPLHVILDAAPATLAEVVIRNTSSKLRRILNTALSNRNRNNPEKYDWYQCNIYYKTIVNFSADSALTDTAEINAIDGFMADKHFFMTETFSRRTWERPQKLQEEVLGSRISGFKKAWFSSLVTDVLPFHAYTDFLNLSGRDYHNPLSNGLYQRYDFWLEDEILQGNDTLWHISFTPKKNAEQLSGSLFIHSKHFAIANLRAQFYDAGIRRTVGIEQQYALVEDKWFPQQLNYFVTWDNLMGVPADLRMIGTSLIDSVSFERVRSFKFDKAHTARLRPGADVLSDSAWQQLRPAPLDMKEQRTYRFMDSLGRENKFDRIPTIAENLVEGFFPLGAVDIDIQRIYSYNRFENHRLGFGLRTGKQLSNRFHLGGWFGYGTGDKMWKYGAWAEIYGDKYKELVFRLGYKEDLQDPGRLQIHPELDRNFLRRFLLGRVDRIRGYSAEVSDRFGYWRVGAGFSSEEIIPQYPYLLNKQWNRFRANEISLNFRYAFAERMTPILGKYYSSGSKYPIAYGKLRFGQLEESGNRYVHAIAAVKWQKHINRIGNEQFLLMGGGVFSKQALPLSKLFAGNGFMVDDNSFYVFGGMQTMLPYQYYSDRFINFYWKHDFDWRLYNLKISKGLSSAPSPGLGYNMLWGSLKDPLAHQLVSFAVPDPAYHEAGLMLNKIVRMKFLGVYYLNLNAGYFYHLQGRFDHQRNGRFVFGLGVDI